MKTTLKVFSIIAVVLGSLAIFEVFFGEGDVYGLIGGGLFITQGILSLTYIKQVENQEK
jgi:hypothetical protein